MPATPEGIVAAIEEATAPGFRAQLLARGQARAHIWRGGELPTDAPRFSPSLSYDLLSYAYGLLGLGLRLRELDREAVQARSAFAYASSAFEAVIVNGRAAAERDFHVIVAAASNHLARFSARAYSLLAAMDADANTTAIERLLVHLMRRDLRAMRSQLLAYRQSGEGSDDRISEDIRVRTGLMDVEGDDADGLTDILVESVDAALTEGFHAAMFYYLLALERGERELVDRAIEKLITGLDICNDLNMVPQWWAHRLAIHLLDDLWSNTYHVLLPEQPSGGDAHDWPRLRELLISVLLKRERAEIDLWPSQTEAAIRAADQSDDLVVSLPTSSGKTRIAELCILRCLASQKRVVFVTPLRALSAQTESGLYRTFGPLGKTVSALYGSTGVSGLDEDSIRESDIVVATPEKLDFALRNDPSLIDDVGLIVFDEGHTIGLGEREVRYEAQIQRLLRRPDASGRRIVCLSAILPDGEQLDDFAGWLRRDQPNDVIKSDWRPTRLRFGDVEWSGASARLSITVGSERPWVNRFITAELPRGRRTRHFPSKQTELCLAIAWRLVEEGQTVLIYCPLRTSVESYAGDIVDLHRRGTLDSLLTADPAVLDAAISLGEEWLGPSSALLECLRLGVALHHGGLPSAYRKEVERLLRDGVIKVTISSPTLAQGLNLSATTLVMHSLHRNGKTIPTTEFANIIGRAGRAYVDTEGLVLHPIFDQASRRRRNWNRLIDNLHNRDLESGLVLLVSSLLQRMQKKIGTDSNRLTEYVLNNAEAWAFAEASAENQEEHQRALATWERQVEWLDTAILSLIADSEVSDTDIESALDTVLQSSLWHRRLERLDSDEQAVLKAGLTARAKYIWEHTTPARRRGYYLAGVGLNAGHALDAIAGKANLYLVRANGAIIEGDWEMAIGAIISIAELVFTIAPFAPRELPENWRSLLRTWLLGLPLTDVGPEYEGTTLRFIEDAVGYRLAWAMEAIRVRAIANGDKIEDTDVLIEECELYVAVAAVEAGTLDQSAMTLIRAGFESRLAAVKAVTDTQTIFTSSDGLQAWLSSEVVGERSVLPDWPTAETKGLWNEFAQRQSSGGSMAWERQHLSITVSWLNSPESAGTPVQLHALENELGVLSADGTLIGIADLQHEYLSAGFVRAEVSANPDEVTATYFGPPHHA